MHNNLGLITPDITRSLGFISMEANRGLGLITPDITRSLGEPIELSAGPALLGVPLATWAIIAGTTGVAGATVGYVSTRSLKSAGFAALGSVTGAFAGVAIATILARRTLGRLVQGGTA